MPFPAYVLPPKALSPVRATIVPPPAGVHPTAPTVCVGRLSPIDVQLLPTSVEAQTPPEATAAKRRLAPGS